MRVSIISDTHSHKEDILSFLKTKPELVIHCGDWADPSMLAIFEGVPVFGVLGNCDRPFHLYNPPASLRLDASLARREIGGRGFAIYHGDDRNLLLSLIDSQEFDVVCTGHTHQVSMTKSGRTLVINPGSLAGIRAEGKKSYAVLDTDSLEAEIRYL